MSFELQPGLITGLLGPNGAGKTTTIRMIAGFLTPDEGRITVAGHDVQADSLSVRRQLGYLPESAPLYPEMTPRDYLDYRARLFNLGRTDRRQAVDRAIDRCRLADMAHKRIGVLSKGYRQRVGLASALLHDPPVLILDEPTNGLDPSQIRSTRDLIRELAQDRTVLLCTHIIPEVERTCARVLVIAAGRLVADDTPERLAGGNANRFEMVCQGPADPALRESIARYLPGIETRLADDERPGWVRVEASGDGVEGEAMHRAAADAGRGVRLLAPVRSSLEERVVRLIDSAETCVDAGSEAEKAAGGSA
ncbi:MAG: ABC transporter ATP-binding protein [Phycisphaeraceae bacterium]|nr:MAG: ABC transporter ATP-binding protein [Phycisphaeraceae bacterium]